MMPRPSRTPLLAAISSSVHKYSDLSEIPLLATEFSPMELGKIPVSEGRSLAAANYSLRSALQIVAMYSGPPPPERRRLSSVSTFSTESSAVSTASSESDVSPTQIYPGLTSVPALYLM
jgi:hypothetical protein